MDKRTRAELFRTRLDQAMTRAGQNRTTLAREIGADRSTLSQLLAPGSTRLPNAQIVGEAARALEVSADWLLGLSDRPEQAQDIAALSLTMTRAARALVDEQIFAWHREAEGYKIRHVPAGLPDMLKTPEMLAWEYAPSLGRTAEQAIGASMDRLDWMREAASDYEICVPLHEFRAFVSGEGYYHGIPAEIRRGQLDRLAELYEQLFPRLRLFLYDARRVFSAPVTIFGPLLAVIYLGSDYLVFRDRARIGALARHFDNLVREAEISDRALPAHVAGIRRQV